MAAILRIYHKDELKDFDITDKNTFSLGGSDQDDFPIYEGGLKRGCVRLHRTSDGWTYQSAVELRSAEKSGEVSLQKVYPLKNIRVAFALFSVDYDDVQTIDIAHMDEISIGRARECQIAIDSKQVSSHHAKLQKHQGQWKLSDLGSSNGTYVNEKKETEAILSPGDFIDIGLCHMLVEKNSLTIRFAGSISIHLPARLETRPYSEETGYPFLFKRSPRLHRKIETTEIEIQTAPTIGSKPSINWLTVLLPPVATIAIMATMVLAFNFSKTSLLFTAPMSMIGILVTVLNYRSQKKKHSGAELTRMKKYDEYLQQIVSDIVAKQAKQREILLQAYPDTANCITTAMNADRELWDRKSDDADFLTLRVGSGDVKSCVSLRIPKEVLTLESDQFSTYPAKIESAHKTVSDCPITFDVLRSVTGGVIGERASVLRLVRNLIIQASTHHSYDDLKIITICSKEEWPEWEFVKWLPHSFDDTRTRRYLACDHHQAEKLLGQLEDTLAQRNREAAGSDERRISPQMPYLLFICADPAVFHNCGIMKYLLNASPNIGAGALFLFDSLENLPKECHTIIEVGGNQGTIYPRENIDDAQQFVIDPVEPDIYDTFARSMAPIRLEKQGVQELPVSVTFLQGYGVKRPEEIDLAGYWSSSATNKSMAVPIGVKQNGEPFYFDIHEKHHGPHGLVAGMTGSGKSEMVQSWILSMALHFPPQDVSIVLIDFKGTGLILPFQNLPHLAGTISDLDTSIGRNLTALENELSRRKALLDQNGVSNISAYIKKYKEGKISEPLSFLFVVIDEFAEFKVQFPDFMTVINRIFAIGRTLGVYILLLTQKPTNVVDDKMNANTRFRWCLKVASSADSKDMLGHPDAAKLTNPGRAFVQVGEDEIYEQIQSYWSGAPYNPNRDTTHRSTDKISVVDLSGNRISYEPERTTGYRAERNEIDAVVTAIDAYVRKHNIERARNIWTQKLGETLYLNQILSIAFDGERWNSDEEKLQATIGMIDDPRSQSQYPLKLDLASTGHVAVFGAPGVGKTTLLQTTILSLALSYPPDAVQMYLMDFGGGNLALFRDLPHVGDVMLADDAEKLGKFTQLIQVEIQTRKKAFSACGASNLSAYQELTGTRLPSILLFLDNFAPVFGMYPNLEDFFINLSREGGTYGVYWFVTSNTQNSLTYRINQNIKMSLALRMTDRADYSMIVGKTDGLEPENILGRGLVKGAPPLEFQTALPVEGDTESQRLKKLRELIAAMDGKWSGPRPVPVPVMPDTVALANVKGEGLAIGLSVRDIERIVYDPADQKPLIISHKAKGGGDSLLRAILQQYDVSACETAAIFDADGSMSASQRNGVSILQEPSEMDDFIAALMPVMQERKQKKQAGEASAFAPILLIIADLKKCFDGISDESANRLKLLVTLGRDLGVVLIAAGVCEEIAALYHGGAPFVASLVDNGAAVLLGGSARIHTAFHPELPFSEMETPLQKDEAYFLCGERTVKIKTVTCQKDGESYDE